MKLKSKIFIAATLLLAASCKKSFLEIQPETFVSSAAFFKTKDDFTQAASGAYNALQPLYSDAYVMGEMRSDNAYLNYKYNDRGGQNVGKEQIAAFIDDPTNQYSNNKYYNCYNIISRANAIIAAIDAAPFDDAEFKKNTKGQAEFLRAFAYFELVQYFGSVPLHLTPVTTQSQTALPQSPVADVYTQIIADANDAVVSLPPTQTEKGRVTSGSANMLLGYVYMTQKIYDKAEAALKAVTGAGYSLLPDYASVFDPANKNSSESIFEVQYMQGPQGLQSNFAYQFIPAVGDTKPITGVTGNNQTFGGWNTPTDDLINSYEAGDKRKDATIALGYTNDSSNFVAIPYCKKYLHPHATFNNTDDDWQVYRYADALLLLAECLNEENKSGEALPFLNQVRARAGLAAVAATDQTSLRATIAHERRVELAFENHRWLDLVRTGMAIEVMNAYGAKQKLKYDYLISSTYNLTPDRLLFPIPFRELTLNKLLQQNPGY